MLGLFSIFLLFISFSSTYVWNNPYYDFENIEQKGVIVGKFQLTSIYTTLLSFVFTLIMWSSGWHSIWGIIAALFAFWGIVYFYLCHKNNVSPFEGKISENSVYNYIFVYLVFLYLYIFTWVQLVIIAWPFLDGILY